MKQLCLLGVLVFIISGCSRSFYYMEAHPHKVYENNQIDTLYEDIDIKIKFGGDAYQYLVFQMDVKNNGTEPLFLSNDKIDMTYRSYPDHPNKFTVKSLDRDQLIDQLEQEKVYLKKEKRANNATNAIYSGLGLLGSIFSQGNIYFTEMFVESSAYMVMDNRSYKLVSNDIDEQIKYIRDWVFKEAVIPAGKSISYDLLFDRRDDFNFGLIRIKCDEEDFKFPFDLMLKEGKVKNR